MPVVILWPQQTVVMWSVNTTALGREDNKGNGISKHTHYLSGETELHAGDFPRKVCEKECQQVEKYFHVQPRHVDGLFSLADTIVIFHAPCLLFHVNILI